MGGLLALMAVFGAASLSAQTSEGDPAGTAADAPGEPKEAAPPKAGTPPVAPSAEEVRKALESRKKDLESTISRAKDVEKDIAALTDERQKINTRLIETAALVQKSEGRLTEIESRLSALEAQETLVRGSLSQRHEQIAKLLAALQRMGRNPPPAIVTKREDALEMVRSAMLLAAAFPGMRTQALELSRTLDDLMRVLGDIRSEADNLKAENTRLNDLKTQLAGLMETKRQTITERQAELQKVRQSASDIAKSVTDLNDLISKLDAAVARTTGLSAYEAEAKAAVLSMPGGAPAGADAVGARSDMNVVELAPTNAALTGANAGRIQPAIPFHLAKAKLPLPVNGRRVSAFGDRTAVSGSSKGIVIETRSGAQVTAPCDGWVVYAGEFRSYGKLLIINPGGGYHVLLAGMSQIDVQPGQFVLAAEPVGTMTTTQKEASGAQSGGPVLYIEFRKDQQPIDPDPWWVPASQKAQG